MNINCLLFDDFETLDVFGPIEVFGKIDMSLGFVCAHFGEEIARGIAKRMEYMWNDSKDDDIFYLPFMPKKPTSNTQTLIVSDGDSRNIIIFRDGKNNPKVEVLFHQNMLWLKQSQIAELFDVQTPAVSKHLKNIFEDGELMEKSVISILETTAADGKNYSTKFYNLDAIIAVGYRTNSQRAIIFRNWATNILREYIQKGSVLDTERLKQPEYIFGQDYFDETLERIRDIRSSERRFYQKITDIYAQCSADYAEDRAKQRQVMYMKDWVQKLNAFLQFNEREILEDNGRVTHEVAKSFAENEFEKFRSLEDKKYISDFDKFILLENEIKKSK